MLSKCSAYSESESESDAKTKAESRSLNGRARRPANLAECLEKAKFIGMVEADAEQWFKDCEACGWRRGDGTLFDNWPRQMSIHRDKLAESRFKFGTTKTGQKPKSVFEIKAIIEAKQAIAQDLKTRNSIDVAMGTEWKDKAAKQKYFTINREIKELNSQIASTL